MVPFFSNSFPGHVMFYDLLFHLETGKLVQYGAFRLFNSTALSACVVCNYAEKLLRVLEMGLKRRDE